MACGWSSGPLAAVEALLDHYRESLLATDFRGGCPVVAVAVESSEQGPDLRDAALSASSAGGMPSPADSQHRASGWSEPMNSGSWCSRRSRGL
jgi:hypothetical protein